MYNRYSLQHTSFFTAINIHVDHLLKRKQQCINLKYLISEPQSYNHQKINKYILWNHHCSSTINVYEIPWEFSDKYMSQQTCYKDMNCLKCVTNQTSYTKKSCSNKMYNFGNPQTFKSTYKYDSTVYVIIEMCIKRNLLQVFHFFFRGQTCSPNADLFLFQALCSPSCFLLAKKPSNRAT